MIRFLRHRQLLFPIALVLAAATVLVLGALEQGEVEPRLDTLPSDRIPVETPRPAVRTDLEKTPLTYISDFWAQLAERASVRLTLIGADRTAALVVGPRLVLTTVAPALEALALRNRPDWIGLLPPVPGGDRSGTGGGNRLAPELEGYRLLGWDEDLGLALFEASGEERVPFTLTDPSAMPSGTYVGAVTLTAAGQPTVTPGYLVTTLDMNARPGGDLVLSMDLPDALSIAAVVNLDGGLMGVAYNAPTGHRIVSAMTMLDLMESIQTEKVCRSVEVADLDGGVKAVMVLESGVLVEYVHREAFLPEPSLLAGDVLLEWAGTRVESAAQFEALYDAQTPGELVRYRVLRNRRRLSGRTVMPGMDCEPARAAPVLLPAIGLAVQWVHDPGPTGSGWRVVAVAPASPSAVAGIQEQDRLLAIDGVSLSTQDDRDLIEERVARGDPLLLSLERRQRMKLVSVEPVADIPDLSEATASGGARQ